MNGTISKIKETSLGGKIICYKDIDSTEGQSGSPVYRIWDGKL